jgi:hypothetical protein
MIRWTSRCRSIMRLNQRRPGTRRLLSHCPVSERHNSHFPRGPQRVYRRSVEEVDGLLAAGAKALGNADWGAARAAFGEAVGISASAQALAGLGDAQWWLGDARGAFSCWERAYAVFRETDPAQAVFVALGLSILYESNFGDRAAAQGWASRAVRIASEVGDPVVAAWASLARAACTDDPSRRRLVGSGVRRCRVGRRPRPRTVCAEPVGLGVDRSGSGARGHGVAGRGIGGRTGW